MAHIAGPAPRRQRQPQSHRLSLTYDVSGGPEKSEVENSAILRARSAAVLWRTCLGARVWQPKHGSYLTFA